MTRPVIVPFTEVHLRPAAALLAARHAAHLVAEPLLDPRYADPRGALEAVTAAWQVEGASGAVALAGDKVVGYLLGAPKADPVWGPNVWVDSAGVAVTEAELARDLYAVAATDWVAQGRTAHYAVIPAHDQPLLDAWFRLGFGQQHAHAVREVPTAPCPPVPGVTVRPATAADIDRLAELEQVLPAHQALAPVFSPGHQPTFDEARAEWVESLEDVRFVNLVAEVAGAVVGVAVGCSLMVSAANSWLIRPPHAGFLGFAAVDPEARGHGVGRALGESVLGWSAEAGFTSVVADWRVTNLLASRAWPRLGFRPSFVRVHRLLGH